MNIKLIDSVPALGCVREYWEEWQSHPNSDFAHYELVCRLRSASQQPIVFLISQNDQPRALLAGRLGRMRLSPRVGYHEPFRISASVLDIIYQGCLGNIDKVAAAMLVEQVQSLLASNVADVAVFHHLPDYSLLTRAVLTQEKRFWFEPCSVWNAHWTMTLPAKSNFFSTKLRSKRRSWLRRKERDLESAFPGRVSWQWISRIPDVLALCRQLEVVASRTYQRALGAGFADDDEHRQRFSLFSSGGQLRVQLMSIDGEPRAFWIGTVYRGVFHSAETAYDPALRQFEVGSLVFARMYDELVKEGVGLFDFGLGDAAYKQRFGDHHWQEVTVRLFAPTARGAAAHLVLALSSRLDEAGRRLVRRFGAIDRVRTGWRRWIAK